MRARTLLSALAVMLLCSCAALYSANPRFGRRAPARPQRPVPARHPMERQKGKLSWPVAGTVVSRFGLQLDPKYGTRTKNQGMDVACNPGSAVVAVAAGKVSYADQFRGYGLMTIVEHGGGLHSIYAGLRELATAPGRSVRERETLGLTADTFHFELRVGGKSVDPLIWLAPR